MTERTVGAEEREEALRRYVTLERDFGLWWIRLHDRGGRDAIGTVTDYGPALTIWGARRRGRRIVRKRARRVEVIAKSEGA